MEERFQFAHCQPVSTNNLAVHEVHLASDDAIIVITAFVKAVHRGTPVLVECLLYMAAFRALQ
jgi:hypothetical protein